MSIPKPYDSTRVEHDEYMLTTIDNPFDPFTQWREWLDWDEKAGYHTSGLLALLSPTSDELSDADQSVALYEGMVEICRENVSGSHMMLTQDEASARFGTSNVPISR